MKSQAHEKLIIYQMFPRILTNEVADCVPNGTMEQNGCGKMNSITSPLLKSIKELGCNAVWYTGIIEHATKTVFPGITPDNPNVVKGEAGSPYAIKDYYDVATAIAENPARRMEEFEMLVQRTHTAGLKAFIDFVPNHTARVYHSDSAPRGVEDFGANDDFTLHFSPNNNYYYITNQQFAPRFDINSQGDEPYLEFPAKATGNDAFTAFCAETDWYETVKLNYGHDYGNGADHFTPIPDTWLKMRDILLFWASKGVDGFRCDMVFMVPLDFWHWVIPQIKEEYPHLIFIGEIYDVAQYRDFLGYGCFDYLYDKVNLYDTLVGIETSGYSAARLTGCWQALEGISERMVNFLENHDEVRFASDAYAADPARVIPSLSVSALISKGPFLLYYGQELGESGEENEGFAGNNHRSTIFDYWSYDTMRRWNNSGAWDETLLTPHEIWLRNTYSGILHVAQREEIARGDLFDLMYVNLRNPGFSPHNHYAFFRYYKDKVILVVANFGNTPSRIQINVPEEAFEAIGMKPGKVMALDLYDQSQNGLELSPLHPLEVTVGANNATILSFSTKDIEPSHQQEHKN